jgi:hypothetical protein
MDFDFDSIIKEVHRWSSIIQNTSKEILETQPKQDGEKKKEN